MNKLSKIGVGLLIAGQISCGNPQSKAMDVGDSGLGEKGKKEILMQPSESGMDVKTSDAIYETLKEENDSIAYTVNQGAPIYMDLEGKTVLCKAPKGIVIRNNAIIQNESNSDFLCVEYGGHKAWIRKTSLTENQGKSMEEIDKPTTEKVIKVNKAARKMEIYDQYGKHKVKEFKIAICSGDEGDKRIEGDGNTPVGKYYICFKNPASSFGTNPKTGARLGSLQVSYPNLQDAFEGLISGDITNAQYNSINNSVKSKGIPSQGTRLGNYIMIHGGGSDYDWTIGCMALDDEDMLRLYNYINKGTDLYIE